MHNGESDLEALQQRHRNEKRNLQATIQSIKKSVAKGDKKREKAAKKQIAELEEDLKKSHIEELKNFNYKHETSSTNNQSFATEVVEKIQDLKMNGEIDTLPQKKISKAERRRQKQAEKAKARLKEIEKAEKDAENSEKFKEDQSITSKLKSMGLMVKEMSSDGNCMYNAVLDNGSIKESITSIRDKTATFMLENKDMFLPYVPDSSNDESCQHSNFLDYCETIKVNGTWGGQLELLAISNVFKQPVHVIQAFAPVIVIGEQFDSRPIVITFHRHQLSMGEHYNSTQCYENEISDDE